MVKSSLLIFIFFNISLCSHGQIWVKKNLLNLATVNFPITPDSLTIMEMPSFKYMSDSALYMVQIQRLDIGDIPQDSVSGFYNGLADGFTERMKSDLVSKSLFNIQGLTGLEMELKPTATNNLPDAMSVKIIYYNSSLITFSFWTYTQYAANMLSNKLYFFNSIFILK